MPSSFVDDKSYKLLIVDSVMALFRASTDRAASGWRIAPAYLACGRAGSDYSGRGELSERQQVRPAHRCAWHGLARD